VYEGIVLNAKKKSTQTRKSPIKKARHGTSVLTAFETIRELIVLGKLAPGTWVIEGELARHLNMSRTPIRGALQQLQRDGFLLEQKGATKSRMVVAPLTREDADDLYSIIARVEGLCGGRIAKMPGPFRADIAKQLGAVNAKLRAIIRTKPLRNDQIFLLDQSFHKIIVQAGAGARLQILHASVESQTQRYWRLYASPIFLNLKHSVAEHEAIIDAILKGDPELVERAIQRNWAGGTERLDQVMLSLSGRDPASDSQNWSRSLQA